MSTIIACDIGGTNCRLGLFQSGPADLELLDSLWLNTADIPDGRELFAVLERQYALREASALVISLAGPVEGDARGRLSNGQLVLDLDEHRESCGRLCLINDFMAQAWAVGTPMGESARRIAGPDALPAATRAVLGAGTGLGYAIICATGAGWLPMPSENGHAGFPFAGREENEFHAFLCARLGIPCASGENVLCGRGLALLHEFLTGQSLAPAEVGRRFLHCQSGTLQWYARFYGRVCRNWMLASLCLGGLWIAGGIAAQNPDCLTDPAFLRELYGLEKWRDLLRGIPLRLMEDKNSGLWGAARFGRQILAEA